MQSQRPLSPHLQVYSLPVTAMMSIFFRFMGISLLGAFMFFIFWLTQASGPYEDFEKYHAIYTSVWGQVLMGLSLWAFVYHACNGLRHLIWDMGKGLSNRGVYWSNLLVIFSSIFLTSFVFISIKYQCWF